ncbi:F-box only protein 15 isoform X2 [Betta splendens]|uniref:F-box only protein 15 isoform X2 n=1 Tax=Betta splendens TaxID=158456 RepID=A0A9W2XQ90_BETSP|nr:F-box only protein 15 isoform X2 [Betta splendens]
MAASEAAVCRMRAVRTSQRADKSSPGSTQNFIERLPAEILMKILSYLDASALFSINHVNKLFRYLANDNALWSKIYMTAFGRNKKQKPHRMDELQRKMATVEMQEPSAGYWKWAYFKAVATRDMAEWKRRLGFMDPYTGLPSQTEQVLRNLHVTWELAVCEESGREDTLELSWSRFFKTSVTVCGSREGSLPSYRQISTLQLHGVWRIGLNCPGLKKRSLMAKLDIQIQAKGGKVIGHDRLVELRLLQPGVIIGVWKGQCSVAFVMFTLHFHRLVERSLLGSPDSPYVEPIFKAPFDDIDPEYGLHGYQLHIVLHNTEYEFTSGSFSQLFCRKAHICDGLIQLTAISRTNLSQHTPLTGNITLPWRCEALQGTVENCCIMTLTLLDEFRKPFWWTSTPVTMERQSTTACYDYDGEQYRIHYQDSDGQGLLESRGCQDVPAVMNLSGCAAKGRV